MRTACSTNTRTVCCAASADLSTCPIPSAAWRASAFSNGWASTKRSDPIARLRPPEAQEKEPNTMTYVVTEACIRCKYMDCVEVCPVDCFYEGENMLVIDPDEWIDCGVCEPECPVEAIIPGDLPPAERWLELNRQYAASWPNITRKKPFPEDADDFKEVTDKYDKYFSPNPGAR